MSGADGFRNRDLFEFLDDLGAVETNIGDLAIRLTDEDSELTETDRFLLGTAFSIVSICVSEKGKERAKEKIKDYFGDEVGFDSEGYLNFISEINNFIN